MNSRVSSRFRRLHLMQHLANGRHRVAVGPEHRNAGLATELAREALLRFRLEDAGPEQIVLPGLRVPSRNIPLPEWYLEALWLTLITREGVMMMDRREFLLGSIGAGIAAALGGGFATAQAATTR